MCVCADVMHSVVSGGGVPWVCGLLDSEHTVMTNEGLVALNLLETLNNGEYLSVAMYILYPRDQSYYSKCFIFWQRRLQIRERPLFESGAY